MLRRVQSKLPDNLSTFNVSGGNLFSESESVLSYSLFSTFQEESMEYLIEEGIKGFVDLGLVRTPEAEQHGLTERHAS